MLTREQILEARVKELEERLEMLVAIAADVNTWLIQTGREGTAHQRLLDSELAKCEHPMPCGHPLSAAVHSDEGTGYCRMCESEDSRQIGSLEQSNDVNKKSSELITN